MAFDLLNRYKYSFSFIAHRMSIYDYSHVELRRRLTLETLPILRFHRSWTQMGLNNMRLPQRLRQIIVIDVEDSWQDAREIFGP